MELTGIFGKEEKAVAKLHSAVENVILCSISFFSFKKKESDWLLY